MSSSPSRPLGVLLCLAAAVVFAAPTLFLPADTHASVKLVFIVGGSVLLAVGIIRVRAEGVSRPPHDEDGTTPGDVTRE